MCVLHTAHTYKFLFGEILIEGVVECCDVAFADMRTVTKENIQHHQVIAT